MLLKEKNYREGGIMVCAEIALDNHTDLNECQRKFNNYKTSD